MKLITPLIARVTGYTKQQIKEEFGEIYGLKSRGGDTLAIIGTIEVEV